MSHAVRAKGSVFCTGVELSTVPAGMQKNRKNREKAPWIIEKSTAR
jgi:hypothetical protein